MPTLSVPRSHIVLGLALLLLSIRTTPAQEQPASKLPDGVVAAWDLADAFRESTNTRERVCINGLWNFQPADAELSPAEVPANDWGWFKVPGCWPGITDYMQKDCQTVFEHPSWDDVRLRQITSAWYQREIAVPSAWTQRRIILRAETVNSLAVVFVDGKQAGEIRYPAGEVDVTAMCRPGQRHRLSIHVTALPLKGVMLSYSDTASAKNVRGSVARRGLCGDVFLESRPIGPRIRNTQVVTSVRKRTLEVATQFDELAPETDYRLQAKVSQGNDLVLEFSSTTFQGRDVADGRLQLSEAWKPAKLWDIHTPQHTFDIQLTLSDANGRVLDTSYVERFGFREFWIDGRDFYLNGSRIFLSSVPVDNAQVGAAWANYEAAKESLLRLKRFGINFVYTHNYGCEPGSHLSFEEILRAADDVGMLVALVTATLRTLRVGWTERGFRKRLRRPCRVLRRCRPQSSFGGRLFDQSQCDRLWRRHESRHDRRHSGSARVSGRSETCGGQCGPSRSSRVSIQAASSTIMPRAILDPCTQSISTRTSRRSRRCQTGSSIGPSTA